MHWTLQDFQQQPPWFIGELIEQLNNEQEKQRRASNER